MGAYLVNQLTAGGQFPHEDCGESCVASILMDAGKADSVADIEHYDLKGGSISGGTSGQVHVDRLAASGIPAHIVSGAVGPMVRDGVARGLNRWMVAIYSNAAGTPYSGPGCVGHWVLVDGFDGTTYSIMQPVGGVAQHYTAAQLEENAQDYSIEVDVPIGAAAPVTGQEVSIVGWMDPGPANQPGWQTARRVKIHEWCHMPGVSLPAGWPAESAMDTLLALWVQNGGEAVFGELFGA